MASTKRWLSGEVVEGMDIVKRVEGLDSSNSGIKRPRMGLRMDRMGYEAILMEPSRCKCARSSPTLLNRPKERKKEKKGPSVPPYHRPTATLTIFVGQFLCVEVGLLIYSVQTRLESFVTDSRGTCELNLKYIMDSAARSSTLAV